jgi:hypothetical protein
LSGQNAVPFVLQTGGGYAPIFNGTNFLQQTATPNYLIDFSGGAPSSIAQLNGITNPSNIPISNDPQYVKLNGTSFVTFAQLNTITCPTAGLALDGSTGWLVSNATTCTTGSLITSSPGTIYCTAICQNGVGWVH